MLRDHAQAEDVTQDVFVAALRRLRATEQPIAFKAWIHEIAKNACIDAWRRTSRADVVSYDEGLGAADRGRLVSAEPAPEAQVDTQLELEQLKGAFEGLSDAHHEILIMRELHGYSYQQIGQRLGMTRAAVESTLFRARRRLGEEFEELGTGVACRRSRAIVAGAEGRGRAGARDELRLARHVAHCDGCRRAAALAGFDLAALAARKGLRAKIGALLPLPAWLRRRLLGAEGVRGPAGRAVEAAPLAMAAEPLGHGVGKLVAGVVAAVVVAVAGAGTATQVAGSGAPEARPHAAASPPASAKRSRAAATTTVATAPGRARATGRPARATGRAATGSAAAGAAARASARESGPRSDAASASAGAASAQAVPAAGTARRAAGSVTTAVAGAASRPLATTPSVSTPSIEVGPVRVPSATVPSVTLPSARQVVRDPVGTATSTATGAVGTVTSAGGSVVGTATGTASSATGAVSKAVAPVTDAVASTTGTASSGSGAGSTLGRATGTAGEALGG